MLKFELFPKHTYFSNTVPSLMYSAFSVQMPFSLPISFSKLAYRDFGQTPSLAVLVTREASPPAFPLDSVNPLPLHRVSLISHPLLHCVGWESGM